MTRKSSIVAPMLFICWLAGCGGGPPAGGGPGGPPERPQGDLALRVDEVTSVGARLSWDAVAYAGGIRVYIAAEPSAASDGTLPDQALVATLPAAARTYRLGGLAAGTRVFVRVVAERAAAPLLWGNTTVRLPGGPRALLETPLREVYAYGPRVLAVVLENRGTQYSSGQLTGDLGPAWQGGAWSLRRRDGSSLGISAVHRHSVPVSQPDYPVGFDLFGDETLVDVDHHIFLVLSEPLGERELFDLAHSGDAGTELSVRLPFSDKYLQTPLIQVNQVGYNPRATRRWAYVSGWMGSGGPAPLSGLPAEAQVLIEPVNPLLSRREAVRAPIAVRSSMDAEAGTEVRDIDLGQVPPAEGVRYRVRIPGVGVSWPTAVSEEAAFRAFYVVARGLFHNRWCGDLSASSTEWTRAPDHCAAYFVEGTRYRDDFFSSSTPKTDSRPLRGGHHDAGDFDIRPFHVLVGQYLLRAYELAPQRFRDGQLDIPESGNGIPDLLDEALWSVAAWEQLQNPDGGVRAGVESNRHPPGIYFAKDDELSYWTFEPEIWHTAYTSGLFAQAAFLVRPFSPARATDLESAARRAYAWAASRAAPEEFLLYGAGELFRLTGESGFRDDYERYWANIDKYGGGAFDNFQIAPEIYPGSFIDYTPAMADYVVGYATSPGATAEVVTTTREELTDWAEEVTSRVLESDSAHRNGRSGGSVDWGRLTSTGRHVDTLYQRLQLGEIAPAAQQRYFDALSLSADYVLGANPAGYCFITGLGSRRPEEPLHLDSLAFIKSRGMPPVPGIPTYGPVSGYPGNDYYRPQGAAFYPSYNDRPLAVRIADTRSSVRMNEFTVWEMQAPLTELFAALIGPGMMPPERWRPGGAEHRSPLPSHRSD